MHCTFADLGSNKVSSSSSSSNKCIHYYYYLTYTRLLLRLGSGYIYWVDNEARTISRIKRDLTQRQVIIGKGIVGCEGMAVDWIAGQYKQYMICFDVNDIV